MALGLEGEGGFVYVIGPVGHTGPYLVKIGCSDNVPRRRQGLQTGSPVGLEILCIIRADDAFRLEREIHQELAEYRRHGEWFELGSDPVPRVKAAAAAVKAAASRARSHDAAVAAQAGTERKGRR